MIPILGGLLEDKMEVAKNLSPVEWMSNDMPAVMLVHGIADSTISYKHAKYMKANAEINDFPVEMILVEGAGHGFKGNSINPDLETIKNKTVKFILKNNK